MGSARTRRVALTALTVVLALGVGGRSAAGRGDGGAKGLAARSVSLQPGHSPRAGIRRRPGRRLICRDRRLDRAARVRQRSAVQLRERQQGAAARRRVAEAGARAPAARPGDEGPARADDHLLGQPGGGRRLCPGRRRGTQRGGRACRDEGFRADARLLGRRPGHRCGPGAVLLPARIQSARPAPRLREGAAREHRADRALGDPAGDRPRLVDLVQGRLAPGRSSRTPAAR